ncbi:helix-turn-helix transcriptional regulator [Haloarchaeobius salinus]|uniref:helix-turn-helix transcriptional regulator n=1 Tax=Haloarchaeobius salinus TaxID=1198298 RepID=UPI00210A0C8D|nr:transcriptional regulator FilR1 domain-containing protein [Haloarchaeobius salinus]
MVGPTERVEFVCGSRSRQEVLIALASEPRERQAVVASTAASESAVYDALNRLSDRGFCYEREDGRVALTGTGRAVADLLERVGTVESVVEEARPYFDEHDLGVLPEPDRRELHQLAGCEVVDSPETDPFRAARRVRTAIADADDISVLAPVYDDRFADALLEGDPDAVRLVLDPEILELPPEDDPNGDEPPPFAELVDIRVVPVEFAMTVTESGVYLSLPRLDGTYDPQTELVRESDDAADWGATVFERIWERAMPVEALLED